jgi:hypothetical protein
MTTAIVNSARNDLAAKGSIRCLRRMARDIMWAALAIVLCGLTACGGSDPAPAGEERGGPNAELDSREAAQALGSTTPASANEAVSFWETRFLSVWDTEHNAKYAKWSSWKDSSYYYYLAYGLDGNIAMYEASKKTQYLDRALSYVDSVINNAQISSSLPTSQYKDSYLGWAGTASNSGLETPLYETYLWRYVMRMMRVIRQTPTLYSNPTYRSQYDRILAFTETHVVDKWFSRFLNSYGRLPLPIRTHMASHWAYICLDVSTLTADATRKARCDGFRATIDAALRGQITPNPKDSSAYFWSDIWGSYSLPGQDTSHGNNVISYMVESHDQGSYWTDADIVGLKNLLAKIIWNGSYAAPTFSDLFDGSYSDTYLGGNIGRWQSDGFLKLGRYDPAVQRIYEAYADKPLGIQASYLTQLYGNGAVNARMLAERAGQLTLSVSRAGPGRVTSLDGRIDCGTDCSESYAVGTTIGLNAVADAGKTFVGWSGSCTGTSRYCSVRLNKARSVTATFR